MEWAENDTNGGSPLHYQKVIILSYTIAIVVEFINDVVTSDHCHHQISAPTVSNKQKYIILVVHLFDCHFSGCRGCLIVILVGVVAGIGGY